MSLLSRVRARCARLFTRAEADAEIEQELRAYVDERTEQGIAAGLGYDEARRRAQVEIGGIGPMTRQLRDQRAHGSAARWALDIIRDARHMLRQSLRAPGFALVAVLTLALGIGGAAALFGLIEGVLLSPPPYTDPDRLVLVSPARLDGAPYAERPTTAQWRDWRELGPELDIALYRWSFAFLVSNDGSTSLGGMEVTPEYFTVLGLRPALGRDFLASEAASGGPPTAVIIGHDLWQGAFDGDPNIIGRTLRLSRTETPLPIVGVMPPNARFLPDPGNASEPGYDVDAQVDYWLPVMADASRLADRQWNVVGRVAPGASLGQVNGALAAIAARQRTMDAGLEGMTATARPAVEVLNEESRRLLLPLFGAVGLVFFIACANVSGLLLARGLHRQRDYLLRMALGATWQRLFRQALTESVVLALLGALVGSAIASGMIALFLRVGAHALPRADAVSIGWPVYAFCLVIAPIAAGIAGLLPAARAAFGRRTHGVENARATAGPKERRLIGGVVVFQMVLTVALLAGAALLVRTARNLAAVETGFDSARVLTMTVATMQRGEAWKTFHADALARVSRLPGIERAAFAWGVPLTGNSWPVRLEIAGVAPTDRLTDAITVPLRAATPDYFDTMAIGVADGRAFRESDDQGAPPVALVNQAFATRYFGTEVVIGRALRFAGSTDGPPMTIVGVIRDARTEALSADAAPEVYVPLWQTRAFSKHLIVRTSGEPLAAAGQIRQTLRELDPTVAVEQVTSMDQLRQDSIAPRTFAMQLLVGFAAVATLLSLVGLYGVVSLSVGSRVKEMAVRKAIGAQGSEIQSLVLREGSWLIGTGVVLGLGVAVGMGRLFHALLFGVPPADPLTLGAIAVLFALCGLAACALPAWRASRVDLMQALRNE